MALALVACAAAIAGGLVYMRLCGGPDMRSVYDMRSVHTPVALQGSAMLITYYSGVMGALMESGRVQPGLTPLRGISGGAWTAALTALGHSGRAQRDAWKRWVAACRERFGSCHGHIQELSQMAFGELLPEDAAQRVGGRVAVALAQLNSQGTHLNGSASWLVGRFYSKKDLTNSLSATSYIPGFSGEAPFTLFRGQPMIDGGFANGFQQLCGHTTSGCLKVASWHVGPRATHTCDPARCGAFAAADSCVAPERREPIPASLFKNEGPPEQWPLAAAGRQRAAGAATDGVAGVACRNTQAPLLLPDFVPHNQVPPDIHPGKFGPLPTLDGREVLACEWQSWAMRLPPGRELEVMDLVYEQGRADGAAWAARQQQLDGVGIFEGRGGADDARHAPGSRELPLATES